MHCNGRDEEKNLSLAIKSFHILKKDHEKINHPNLKKSLRVNQKIRHKSCHSSAVTIKSESLKLEFSSLEELEMSDHNVVSIFV